MITTADMLSGLEQGSVPFSFEIDGDAAVLEFSHQRPKRRRQGKRDFIYSVANAPITVVVETKNHPERDYMTYRIRLIAEQSVKQRISNVRIFEVAGLDATAVRGWEGGYAPDRDASGEKWRIKTVPPMLWKMWDKDLDSDEIAYQDLDGRSSCNLFPVWFLYNESGGLWYGPEWSGSWSMATGKDKNGAYAWFSLCMLDFEMLQGEEVQLPPVSLGAYQGSIGDGCVTLRRILRDDFMPTINGEKPLPPVSAHHIGGSIPELDWDGLKRAVDYYASIGMEQFIWASGWYRPPRGTKTPFSLDELKEMFPNTRDVADFERVAWWEQCGLYEPDAERFPEGIEAFVDYLKERGMVMGLWYDPRLNIFTDAQKQWRDALTRYKSVVPADKSYDLELIDMGREAGRECMFELLERFVVEFGAKHVWHDLNTSPRFRFWHDSEAEGRKGLMELRHYMGSDMVYDRFMKEYPDVWIKWCGSGGSMMNLGVLRRVHNFRLADFGGVQNAETMDSDALRDMRTGLNWILPTPYLVNIMKLPGAADPNESREFALLNQFGSIFGLHHTCRNWTARDRADAVRIIGVYKNLRHYLRDGDFWSLWPFPQDQTGWDGWQFHDQKTGTGILVFFKRQDALDQDSNTAELRWPEADLTGLDFTSVLGEVEVKAEGKQLAVTMPSRAALVRYDRIPTGDPNDFLASD